MAATIVQRALGPQIAGRVRECSPINAALSTLQFHPGCLRASFAVAKAGW